MTAFANREGFFVPASQEELITFIILTAQLLLHRTYNKPKKNQPCILIYFIM